MSRRYLIDTNILSALVKRPASGVGRIARMNREEICTSIIVACELRYIKAQFLATAVHYTDLGKHNEQYAALLTFAALELGDPKASVFLKLRGCSRPAQMQP